MKYKQLAKECSERIKELESEMINIKEQEEKREQEKKKRYEATVYCSNCQNVKKILVPAGLEIINGDCTNCRVRSSAIHQTLFIVIDYPGKNSFI